MAADPELDRYPEVDCYLELFERGIVVRDDFIDAAQVDALVACAAARRARGEFAAARIGGVRQRRGDLRGDHTCWLGAPLFPAEQALLAEFENLRLSLNREGYLGLFDLEVHYAWYPPGAGYARHVDQPFGCDQRQVTVIVYLNTHWTPEAGGLLRIFEGEGEGEGEGEDYRDVEPVAGRLVCFLAAGREHCVLPAVAQRLSVTGWFRRRS